MQLEHVEAQQQQQPLHGSAGTSSITVGVGADGTSCRQCLMLLVTPVASGCGS
jgi:hypothetical protein